MCGCFRRQFGVPPHPGVSQNCNGQTPFLQNLCLLLSFHRPPNPEKQITSLFCGGQVQTVSKVHLSVRRKEPNPESRVQTWEQVDPEARLRGALRIWSRGPINLRGRSSKLVNLVKHFGTLASGLPRQDPSQELSAMRRQLRWVQHCGANRAPWRSVDSRARRPRKTPGGARC